MKERPILFRAAMVRAILDSKKTQTRRPVKPQPTDPLINSTCPYGKMYDQLWVRETGWMCEERFFAYDATPNLCKTAEGEFIEVGPGAPESNPSPERLKELGWVRRSSIHMPRWASRILLEVCEVRVERLQDITNADARAEGVYVPPLYADEPLPSVDIDRNRFRALYVSIHGPDAWTLNPFVWVIGFRRLIP